MEELVGETNKNLYRFTSKRHKVELSLASNR